MLETYFSAAKMLGHLRSGPSGPYLDGFAAALEQQGYGPETAVRYLRAAAHIGHVMAEQGAGLTDVDLAAFGERQAADHGELRRLVDQEHRRGGLDCQPHRVSA